MRFLPSVYDIYSFLFSIYVVLIFCLLIKYIFSLKKISLSFLFVFLLSVFLFFIKIKTAFFLDARPTATFEALQGLGNKYPCSLLLFLKVLSWIKPPHFHDIITYNIFLGSLTLLLCYFYFSLITKNKSFGAICAFFLAVSSLFYQATISSEYFLTQWIFAFSVFLFLHRLKKSTSHINILLFFLSYLLLVLSRVEAFILIGIFPFLPFLIKREAKFNRSFFICYWLSTVLICLIVLLLANNINLRDTAFRDSVFTSLITGGYPNGYLRHYWCGLLTVLKQFPTQSIAFLLLFILIIIYKPIKTFDLSTVLIIFIPIFVVSFFIHREGFCHQEGRIKFSCQMIPLFLYGWCVVMWNLLELLKKQKHWFIKIGIFSLILFINLPHFMTTCSAADEYIKLVRQMETNPFNVHYDTEEVPLKLRHLYLQEAFVYQINFICDMIEKKKLRTSILDFDCWDDIVYNYIIKNRNPDFLYFSIKDNIKRRVQAALPEIKNSDLLILISIDPQVDPNQSIDKLIPPYLNKEEKLILRSFERRITILGISEQGSTALRKY